MYTERSTHTGKHIAFHYQCCPLWAVGELQPESHCGGQGAGTGLTVLRFPDTSPLPTLFPLFSLNGFVRYLQCSCSHEMRLKEKKKGSQPLGTQGAAGPSGCWGWAGAPGGLGGLPPEDITVPSLCLLRQSATHCLEARR